MTTHTNRDRATNIDLKEISDYVDMILQIDKVARIWIDFLLHQAAQKAKKENTEQLLKDSLNLPNTGDTIIIQRLIEGGNSNIFDNNQAEVKRDKITILKRRIEELEKFSMLNGYIVEAYREVLNSMTDSAST